MQVQQSPLTTNMKHFPYDIGGDQMLGQGHNNKVMFAYPFTSTKIITFDKLLRSLAKSGCNQFATLVYTIFCYMFKIVC